jgi:hypothetical protein
MSLDAEFGMNEIDFSSGVWETKQKVPRNNFPIGWLSRRRRIRGLFEFLEIPVSIFFLCSSLRRRHETSSCLELVG